MLATLALMTILSISPIERNKNEFSFDQNDCLTNRILRANDEDDFTWVPGFYVQFADIYSH